MSFGQSIKLSNGALMPQIGFGTYMPKPDDIEIAVEIAVRNGYRHLDCAMVYRNQHEIARTLKKLIPSVVKREELFITSKLWNHSHQPDEVEKELDETLKLLGLEYLDLYLIHWPAAFVPGNGFLPPSTTVPNEVELDTHTSLIDTWKAMINLPKAKVRAVGVSNYSIPHIEALIQVTGVPPVVNQIEAHPFLLQPELTKYCEEKGVHVTAYSLLGNNKSGKPKFTEHPVVQEIARNLNATPAQVLIAWAVRRGQSVIPRSSREDRIISNFQQIKLSDDDFAKVSKIGEGNRVRYNIPFNYSPSWSISIFGEEDEKKAREQVNIES